MINSAEVCFDITRQQAQVGHKNINIVSYKNHLVSSAQMENIIYKTIHCITLCNFWHRS
jgi:hypothetical protein